ncbi:glycosyltransferase family 4 protein [Sphingomonas sp. OK281]|uniref:glycosyltransferase family 4 protein n=1 Tax=Sphingomonas sp. OK281 TaxID=1881067 RepID=UPI0008F16A54|nr:glycosyltransferase family 4 protein [Sphingomonas sp. OK281]SFN82068.1 Glycosyl transferases group 1 [Sphingomonas sp. OK281]
MATRTAAANLTVRRSVVVISDWVDGPFDAEVQQDTDRLPAHAHDPASQPWTGKDSENEAETAIEVAGGYLERLPLALIAAGIVDQAEIWHHWRGDDEPPFHRDSAVLARRAFRLDHHRAPFASTEMASFVRTFGAPHILVVLGLGVAPDLLALCANSIILYNSIDAPSLRVPPEVSEHFDLVLTGAQWQSDEVEARHPGMPTAILPVGPEFAAIDQFRPLGTPKDLDLIYVAAAQPYKRHDILFDALARLPRDVRALCVFGYGEDADMLRDRARDQNLSIEFVGPPGVPIDEVNRLMNRAKFGVVCGIDDGAPAILTEYMLAGLPVLANAELRCGLQFILPETGMIASTNGFADAILTMRETTANFRPRDAVLERWTWTHSVSRLAQIIEQIHDAKQ